MTTRETYCLFPPSSSLHDAAKGSSSSINFVASRLVKVLIRAGELEIHGGNEVGFLTSLPISHLSDVLEIMATFLAFLRYQETC